MKALKIGGVVLLAVAVLLVAAVGVLMLPGVQRGIATRVVATGPGESLELDYLRVGWNRTEARGVVFQQPDASYRVGGLEAELSLSDLIFRRELRLGDVLMTGVALDLSRMEPTEDPEPFEGILRQMELPMPLYLDNLRVEGELLLPGTGAEPMRSDFVLTGGGFAPGREGELHLAGDLRAPGALPLFAGLELDGTLTVFQADRGRIERARLLGQVSVRGAQAAPGEGIRAEVLLLATDEGEEYQAHFGRLLVNQEAGDRPDLSTLVSVDATYLHREGVLEGSWEIEVDREQLAVFFEGVELPAFAARGGGSFTYGIAGEILDLKGELGVTVDDLGLVAEELRELGGFALNSRFDLRMDEQSFRLGELLVRLRDGEGNDLLEARNFQEVRYNRLTEQLEGADERMDLAEVTIRGLPVEWANLFLQAGAPEMAVRGGNATGRLLVSAEGGGIFFQLTEPLRVPEFGVLSEGDPMLVGLSVEIEGGGSFQDGEARATLAPWRILQNGQTVASGEAAFDGPAGSARAELQADLARLLGQPALQGMNNLSAGVLAVEAEAALGERMAVQLNGTLRDLVSRDEGVRLPRVVFGGSAREVETDVWELDLPVRIEGTAPSDVRVAGRLSLGEELSRFALMVSGDRLAVNDALAVASGFSAPVEEAGPGQPPVPVEGRDDVPVWAGFEGRIELEIADVRLQEEYGMENLRGELQVDAGAVVSALRAVFLDSPVRVDARVRFLAEEERPYVLEGTMEAPELAAGDLFRQLQPGRPPTLEGLFGVAAEISGEGINLLDLIDRIRFQLRLQSGGGIIRLLYSENPLAEVGMAASVLFGALGRDAAAVSDIARRLSNMPYEELTLSAERGEDLNIVVRNLRVLSPEIHLRGAGRIDHRENVGFLRQPMTIELQLGARGPLERLLESARMLGQEQDDLGYRKMRRDFAIRGTPANPDASFFYRMVIDTVLRFVAPGGRAEEPENGEPQPERERPRIPIPDIFDRILR